MHLWTFPLVAGIPKAARRQCVLVHCRGISPWCKTLPTSYSGIRPINVMFVPVNVCVLAFFN